MVHQILSTDMAMHFKKQAEVKDLIEKGQDINEKERMKLISFCFHMSDISTSSRHFDVFDQWTECVYKEFFYQGDLERERKVPINFLCYRNTVNLAKEQVGFIDFFVLSAYDVIGHYLPEAKKLAERAI